MPQSQHERKKVVLIPYPLDNREDIENRIKACGQNIHSPYSWYREDVRRLLIICDFLHTENMELKAQQEEE